MRVSIVTPTFNSERFILETAKGVLSQSHEDWEWIVVDDGSEDQTMHLLDDLQNPRIRLFKAGRTANPAGCRNFGIRQATGSYIAILDHDDVFDSRKLAAQVSFLARYPKVGAVHTNVRVLLHESGELTLRRMRQPPREEILGSHELTAELLKGNFIYMSSVVYRSEVIRGIGGFDEDPLVWGAPDFDCHLRLAELGCDLGFIDEPLLIYRQVQTSMIHDTGLNLDCTMSAIRRAVTNNPTYYERFGAQVGEAINLLRFKKGLVLLKNGDKAWRPEILGHALESPLLRTRLKWLVVLLMPHRMARFLLKWALIRRSRHADLQAQAPILG